MLRLIIGVFLTGLSVFARPFGAFADYGSLGLFLDAIYLVVFGVGAYLILTVNLYRYFERRDRS